MSLKCPGILQIQQLEDEKDQMASQVEKLQKQLASQTDHNANLRNENEELRQQLGIEVLIFTRINFATYVHCKA